MLTSRFKMFSIRPRRGERRADSSSLSSESRMIVRTSGTGATSRTRCRPVSSSSLRRSGAKPPVWISTSRLPRMRSTTKPSTTCSTRFAPPSVPVLELGVQRALVERPDRPELAVLGWDGLEDGVHDEASSLSRRSRLRPDHRPDGQAALAPEQEPRCARATAWCAVSARARRRRPSPARGSARRRAAAPARSAARVRTATGQRRSGSGRSCRARWRRRRRRAGGNSGPGP